MNISQIIMLSLGFIGMLLEANRHGKHKEGKHNFWASLIAAIIHYSLLYWGGFFDNILN